MEIETRQTFDAFNALRASDAETRVQRTHHQSNLDISAKARSSVLPWRGQFSPQLVEFLLSENTIPGECVLDPFCGSGTVMFEVARLGRNARGFDVNPAAICLAKVSELSTLTAAARHQLAEAVDEFVSLLRVPAANGNGHISPSEAVHIFHDLDATDTEAIALMALLLLSFGSVKQSDIKKINRAEVAMQRAIFDAPVHSQDIQSAIGDARFLPVKENSVDYILTSPPYINVFNYHQNYRPIVEALGFLPLVAAKSEVGANRKFRQNRYMTAVQYCMDMGLFLVEAGRVARPDGVMTIVLGRESNIRSVAFKNGEIISAIAVEGLGCELLSWHERKFMNRFGESIYEDVLSIRLKDVSSEQAVQIGRDVGAQVLRNALEYCPEERRQEIETAIEAAPKIEASPEIKR